MCKHDRVLSVDITRMGSVCHCVGATVILCCSTGTSRTGKGVSLLVVVAIYFTSARDIPVSVVCFCGNGQFAVMFGRVD